MKIIFDNKEQMEGFIRGFCPFDLDGEFPSVVNCYAGIGVYDKPLCTKCWSECGVEMEVKDGK